MHGKTVRIKVKTVTAVYVGDFTMPAMRKRISDVLNEEERQFINLTDVRINEGKEIIPFVSVNKILIEAIFEEVP